MAMTNLTMLLSINKDFLHVPQMYRVRQIPFFLENALKKTAKYFLNFLFFYLKVQSFRLIIENNFIQMAASAGHTVAYTIA